MKLIKVYCGIQGRGIDNMNLVFDILYLCKTIVSIVVYIYIVKAIQQYIINSNKLTFK